MTNVTKLYKDDKENVSEVLDNAKEYNSDSVIVISVIDGEPILDIANIKNPFEILSLLQYAEFIVNSVILGDVE